MISTLGLGPHSPEIAVFFSEITVAVPEKSEVSSEQVIGNIIDIHEVFPRLCCRFLDRYRRLSAESEKMGTDSSKSVASAIGLIGGLFINLPVSWNHFGRVVLHRFIANLHLQLDGGRGAHVR